MACPAYSKRPVSHSPRRRLRGNPAGPAPPARRLFSNSSRCRRRRRPPGVTSLAPGISNIYRAEAAAAPDDAWPRDSSNPPRPRFIIPGVCRPARCVNAARANISNARVAPAPPPLVTVSSTLHFICISLGGRKEQEKFKESTFRAATTGVSGDTGGDEGIKNRGALHAGNSNLIRARGT